MIGSKYGIGKHALAIPESNTVPMLKVRILLSVYRTTTI